MPARRTSLKLKLAEAATSVVDPVARDAQLAGLGIEWSEVPGVLDETARVEWQRLAAVFAEDPVRFREGDRAALTAYCVYWSAFATAAADVARDGPVVEGRSDKDRGRLVKNPATVAMREAATQLRYWCRELALTPDARAAPASPTPTPTPTARTLITRSLAEDQPRAGGSSRQLPAGGALRRATPPAGSARARSAGVHRGAGVHS